MNIVIAGAGQVGTHLAKMLSTGDHNITLLDNDEEKLKPMQAYDLMTMKASSISIINLKDANIKNCDLFIAVTPHETENITACMLAKDLGAKETVARIDNNGYVLPENKERFKRFGVDSLIYPELLAAKEIVQSLRMPGIRQLHEFEDERLLLVGIKMKQDAPILNIPISMLDLHKKGMRIMSISRKDKTFIPNGKDEIKDGDIVLYITERNNLARVRKENGRPNFDVKNVMILGGSRIGIKTA
nr:NAD-binding protein [Bacteroidales bacterium]